MSEYYYPISNNVTGAVDMLQYINSDLTGNGYGIMILLGTFIISFAAMKNYPTERALAASSFFTTLVSFFMFILGLIPLLGMTVPTIMTLVSVFFLSSGSRR